jgi:hypothetical protein
MRSVIQPSIALGYLINIVKSFVMCSCSCSWAPDPGIDKESNSDIHLSSALMFAHDPIVVSPLLNSSFTQSR